MDVAEERRFAFSSETKSLLISATRDPTACAEEGYVPSNHKEMFHFTSKSDSCQVPNYWHVPTAAGDCHDSMKRLCSGLFDGINVHVLRHLRSEEFAQDAFPNDDEYLAWINAHNDSDKHLLTSFLYHESNPEHLHAAAHVDRGLISICANPNDLQVRVRGEWIDLGPQPPGVYAVLCGYTLERVTGGVFRAVSHRVQNRGERRSRVFKVRLDPSLLVRPASVVAFVSPAHRAHLPQDNIGVQGAVRVGELMEQFDRYYTSVNAPSNNRNIPLLSNGPGTLSAGLPSPDESAGILSTLPIDLLLRVLDWLRDLGDLARLSQTCQSLKRIAGMEALCIPAAESSHVDWGAALDQIDLGVPSLSRLQDDNAESMSPRALLASVSNRWLPILGAEMTDKEARDSRILQIRFRDMTGEETFFRIRYNTRMNRLMMKYAQRKGVSVGSLRFLWEGERIEEDWTCASMELLMNDQVDAVLERRGD